MARGRPLAPRQIRHGIHQRASRPPADTVNSVIHRPCGRPGKMKRASGFLRHLGVFTSARRRTRRGRRGPDGAARLLGRPDFQLETSGESVEPDEIEHAILHLADVTACAVVPVTVSDVGGSLVCCAYVPSHGRNLNARELRRQLAERLPEGIIPSRWLILDELPIDSRGKVDRAFHPDAVAGLAHALGNERTTTHGTWEVDDGARRRPPGSRPHRRG